MPTKVLLLVRIAAVSMLWTGVVHAQDVPGCGSLDNAYGPFDYRDPVARTTKLPIVESHHFTHDVESLRRGSTGTVEGDFGYTLRAFPNHPRALQTVARYALRGGRFPQDGNNPPSAECYFLRALAFAPTDEVVHEIYANYLAKLGDRKGAREQYEDALNLAPESAEISYNAALFFVQEGELARAKELAAVAYDKGYPLPGLRNKIAAAEAAKP